MSVTYEEYSAIKDQRRYEVVDGVIYATSPAPNRRHQTISGEIYSQISFHLREKDCHVFYAPFDVRLPKADENSNRAQNVVQPDIVVVCDEEKLDDAGCVGAPDLVIEILSLSTARMDLMVKKDLYEEHGVREYWIVDPENNTVTVLKFGDGRFGKGDLIDENGVLQTDILPGLSMDLKRVFKE